MLEFPERTARGNAYSANTFLRRLKGSGDDRRKYIEEIQTVVWRNTLSSDTLNVEQGERIKELHVFELVLNQSSLSDESLKLIDNNLHFQVLFLLRNNDLYQACIGYKETDDESVTRPVTEHYRTAWFAFDQLPLAIEGLSMDQIYDNFVRQIHPELAQIAAKLSDAVDAVAKRQALQKKIDTLGKKLRTEKQPHRQFELHQQIQELRKQLEEA